MVPDPLSILKQMGIQVRLTLAMTRAVQHHCTATEVWSSNLIDADFFLAAFLSCTKSKRTVAQHA